MITEQTTQPTAADPQIPTIASADDAVAALAGNIHEILGLEDKSHAPERARDEGGRFAKQQQEADEATEAEAEQAEEAEATAAADDEGDVIELPPEKEGEQPKRVPLAELIERANKAEAIERELAEVKNKPLVTPEVFDRATLKAVEAAQQYGHRLQQWVAANEPQPPHPAYGNPHSEHYDPDRYARGMAEYRAQVERYNGALQELERVGKETAERQEMLRLAEVNRHHATVREFWPELKDEKVARKVQTDLITHFGKYGMSAELIGSITHPAFYALAQAALKGLQYEAVKEQAAKVVQAKPKLIKGQARQPVSSNPQRDAAVSRFSKTRSDADAIAALAQIL